jgi:hypothetical protein
MSGLLRRLTRRRPATADETGSPVPESSEPAGAPAETPAEPGGDQPVAESSEQATQMLPQTGEQPATEEAAGEQTVAIPPTRDLPAGIDPSEYAEAPVASAPRGKLRRRLRYLRRVRDLLLRDLGGFAFEIHRTARGTPTESHRKLAESKLSRIDALDAEVRALEGRLGEPHEPALLREPGIGGICPECGELHASDAHYCAHCGAPLDAKARAKREAAVAAAVHDSTSARPAAESAPASVLWAAGPRPAGAEPEPAPDDQPSEVTSKWLAVPRRADAPAAETSSEPATTEDDAVEAQPETAEPEAAKAADEQPAPAVADDAPAADETLDPPAFEPAPNGRRTDDVPAPDPLPSQREQGT